MELQGNHSYIVLRTPEEKAKERLVSNEKLAAQHGRSFKLESEITKKLNSAMISVISSEKSGNRDQAEEARKEIDAIILKNNSNGKKQAEAKTV